MTPTGRIIVNCAFGSTGNQVAIPLVEVLS